MQRVRSKISRRQVILDKQFLIEPTTFHRLFDFSAICIFARAPSSEFRILKHLSERSRQKDKQKQKSKTFNRPRGSSDRDCDSGVAQRIVIQAF